MAQSESPPRLPDHAHQLSIDSPRCVAARELRRRSPRMRAGGVSAMSIRNLEALFQPRSIAVIGASDRPGSVGSVVLRNLKGGGFKGPIWPVNPRHATVDAGPAWPDVASLPEVPDLAVICTPASTVPDLVAELGRQGARAAIVMTAGLKQPASQGATLEQAMLAAARPYLLRILGPNCIGALVPGVGLNASFSP